VWHLFGKGLGFEVASEVSDSLLRLRLEGAYRPHIDILWSIRLDTRKRKAIAWLLGRDVADVTHVSVVGIEVEGTDPSTRTMAADVANLAALGAPLGLLMTARYSMMLT
jgi:hypothetical protein